MLRDRSSISDGLLSLFSGDGRRCVAVIEAYIDESAKTLIGRPLYAVSGAVGIREEWKQFEAIWEPVLDVAGVPYYHGKDRKCDRLRRPMVSAIQSSGVRGFTSTTFEDEYSKAGNDLKSLLGNHYAFLALSMALHIRDWAKRANVGPVAYVLEDGQPNVEHVITAIKTLVGPDAASVAFAGKRDFVGLQVADFLAHHTAALDKGLVWINELLGDGPGQVMWAHLDPSGINTASLGMTQALRRHRHRKTQAKRKRKALKKRG